MKHTHHHNLDFYAYVSGIRQWNSTFKVIFSMLAIIIVITVNSIWVSIGTIGFMAMFTIKIGKVHKSDYLRLLKIPLVFIVLSGAAIMLQFGNSVEGCVVLPNGTRLNVMLFGTFFYIEKSGLYTACAVGLKAFAAVSAMYMLTLSTPMGNILYIFRKMHIPSLMIELMHLIYRYIFILSDVSRLQRDAAASRLGYHNYRSSLRSFSSSLSNLLVLSLKRANACYDAMEARGYDGELFVLEEEQPVDISQLIWLIMYITLVVVMLLCHRFYFAA